MEFLVDFWLPILVATVVLWFMSFFFWALLPHHFGDFAKAANEDELVAFLKTANLPAGNYKYPYAGSAKEQNDKDYVEKFMNGPQGVLSVYNTPNMGANMVKTIFYFLVTVGTIGYITHVACPPGDEATTFMKLFRIAGTIGVLTFASSGAMHRIWFTARHWTHVVDGVAYGLVCGLIFGFLG